MIHIGEKIREICKEKRVKISELAKMVCTSRRNFYDIFKRQSIDTGLLQKISIILEYDFFQELSQEIFGDQDQKEELKKIKELEKENELLREINKLLQKNIRLIEEGLKLKKSISRPI